MKVQRRTRPRHLPFRTHAVSLSMRICTSNRGGTKGRKGCRRGNGQGAGTSPRKRWSLGHEQARTIKDGARRRERRNVNRSRKKGGTNFLPPLVRRVTMGSHARILYGFFNARGIEGLVRHPLAKPPPIPSRQWTRTFALEDSYQWLGRRVTPICPLFFSPRERADFGASPPWTRNSSMPCQEPMPRASSSEKGAEIVEV